VGTGVLVVERVVEHHPGAADPRASIDEGDLTKAAGVVV
jgi:hypothetical protein